MYRVREWLRREARLLILGVLLIAICLNCVLAPHGLRDLLVLRHYRIQLEGEHEQLQAKNRELQSTIKSLKSDDTYLQRVIRKELGFARPNELIYRFAGESQPPSSNPP